MRKRRLKQSDKYWLAGVALLVLLQFWWLPGDPGTPDDTYSVTVEGKRGFFQTLENLAEAGALSPVHRETNRLIPQQNGTLVILSPDRYPNENEQHELATFVRNGGTLLFAPNWVNPICAIPQLSIRTQAKYFQEEDLVTTIPPPAMPVSPVAAPAEQDEAAGLPEDATSPTSNTLQAEVDEETPVAAPVTPPVPIRIVEMDAKEKEQQQRKDAIRNNTSDGTALQPPVGNPADLAPEYDLRNVADFNTDSTLVEGAVSWRTRASVETASTNATILVKSTAGTPQAASWNYGSGRVVVCASPDVFSNRSMLDETRAELAIRLVEYTHAPHATAITSDTPTPIVISEFLNASDAYRGTAVLLNPSLRSGTLQLLTIALLVGWFGFYPFGPARKITAHRRRSLTESATAVGNLQFRSSNGNEVIERYLDYFKTRLQRLFGRSVGIDDTPAIAVRANMEADDVRRRITAATQLAKDNSTSNPEAAAAIRDLCQILDRLSGSKRGDT